MYKILQQTVAVLALLSVAGGACAEDKHELAVLNATHLSNLLQGVAPNRLEYMVSRIAENRIQRKAPRQPVWILSSETGAILYYQGQRGFAGQPAAQLVDDHGVRFGIQALERAKAARSGWVSLQLTGAAYQAFCVADHPTVVCSLAVR